MLFQPYWDIIFRPELQILYFFSKGIIYVSLNATDIVLIPVFLGHEKLSQYRIISFCNFACKVVSEVLVN